MKLPVNTTVNKAGGCTDCRAVAFNSLTITAIRHLPLFLPVNFHVGFTAEFGCRGLMRCQTWTRNALDESSAAHKLQAFVFNVKKTPSLLQNTGVWFTFPWIIKNEEICCKSRTAFSGFDSEALSCEQAFHTSRSNLHTGCLAMVQCFNTKRFSFLFTKAYLLCS